MPQFVRTTASRSYMLQTRISESPCPRPGWASDATLTSIDAIRAVAEVLPQALLVTDADRTCVLLANQQFGKMWRTPDNPSLSRVIGAIAALAVDPIEMTAAWELAPVEGIPAAPVSTVIILTDGREIDWLRLPLTHDSDHWGDLHLFTEAPSSRDHSAQGTPDALFQLAFEKAAVGIALIAPDGRFLRVNGALCGLLGYDEASLLACPISRLIHPDDFKKAEPWPNGLKPGRDTFHLELRCLHRGGAMVWLYVSASVIRSPDGQLVYGLLLAEDITPRKQREAEQEQRTQELMTLASTDPLTGLYNHRFMHECVNRRLEEAKRNGQPLSVLMLDADQFRELNLQYGHDAGNRALCCLADGLRQSLREGDVACRYGGDEFVAILAGVAYPAAAAAAERVRRRVEEAGRIAALGEPLTCSIGPAPFPNHASTTDSLLKAADLALYQAKYEGKNRVVGYEDVSSESLPTEIEELKTGLQGASLEAVNALVTAIDLRDRFTGAHCQRVARVSLQLAVRLGLSDEEVEAIRLGAPLLDVGKIGLPDALLTKEGKLTQAEWGLIKKHP
ncbi:MAG: diguanylate cyclase, partial [Actinomycetota bacterium]